MGREPLAAPLAELERPQRGRVDPCAEKRRLGRGHRLGQEVQAGDDRHRGIKQFALGRHAAIYRNAMHQALETFTIRTDGTGLYEVTDEIAAWLRGTGIATGLVTLFCQHTSAGLLITENASPAVHRDLLRWLAGAAPENGGYEHSDEGPDDMPAHIKALLTGASLAVPVSEGRMMLGTWQGVFLAEHRRAPHRRRIVAHLTGA
jgi:secondary thiamine-phosphate synthase enzyme